MHNSKQKLTITQWDENDRPREKMLQKGARNLSNTELIAILIGSGNLEETAVELSQRILLSCHNNLNELAQMDLERLCQFKGIGTAKAVSILAANELGRRRSQSPSIKRIRIEHPEQLFHEFYPLVADLPIEEFWVILLNRQNQLIDLRCIAKGGISEASIDIRLIFGEALKRQCSAIAICHNHPSGNIQPSRADNQLTQRIKKAGNLLKIPLIDHIIIANNHYYSYANAGNL
jgi:DNA repair protein RadC